MSGRPSRSRRRTYLWWWSDPSARRGSPLPAFCAPSQWHCYLSHCHTNANGWSESPRQPPRENCRHPNPHCPDTPRRWEGRYCPASCCYRGTPRRANDEARRSWAPTRFPFGQRNVSQSSDAHCLFVRPQSSWPVKQVWKTLSYRRLWPWQTAQTAWSRGRRCPRSKRDTGSVSP